MNLIINGENMAIPPYMSNKIESFFSNIKDEALPEVPEIQEGSNKEIEGVPSKDEALLEDKKGSNKEIEWGTLRDPFEAQRRPIKEYQWVLHGDGASRIQEALSEGQISSNFQEGQKGSNKEIEWAFREELREKLFEEQPEKALIKRARPYEELQKASNQEIERVRNEYASKLRGPH